MPGWVVEGGQLAHASCAGGRESLVQEDVASGSGQLEKLLGQGVPTRAALKHEFKVANLYLLWL